MLVGSFSSNLYAIPRSTEDADFVVDLGERSILDVIRRVGPGLILNPQMSFETATGTTRHELSLADNPFKIELFPLSLDPHDQARFRRRVRARILGRDAWAPTAEDVIITKLRWARPKDKEDIRDLIAVQAGQIGWTTSIPGPSGTGRGRSSTRFAGRSRRFEPGGRWHRK